MRDRLLRRRYVVAFFVMLTGVAYAAETGYRDQRPTVRIDSETWQGDFFSPGKSHAVFKGLPYAAPPVGPLRWRPPQNHEPVPGLRTARAYGPACVQTQRLVHWENRILEKIGRDALARKGCGAHRGTR
jgi:para-nitrobenzyl esterase